MNLIRFVLLALLIGMGIQTVRAAEIEDPQGLLARIENSRQPRSFEESYRLGDEAVVRILNKECAGFCGYIGPMRVCMPLCRQGWSSSWPDLTKTIAETTPEQATAVYSDGTVENFEAAEFTAGHGGYLRKTLRDLDQTMGLASVVRLSRLAEIDFVLVPGEPPVPAFDLRGEMVEFEAERGSLHFRVVVGKNVPGVAEILHLSFSSVSSGLDSGATKLFQVRSIR